MSKIVNFSKVLEYRLDNELFINDNGDEIRMPVMTMTQNEFLSVQVLGMLYQLQGLKLSEEEKKIKELLDKMKAASQIRVNLADNWELRNLMRRYSPQFVEELKSGKFAL